MSRLSIGCGSSMRVYKLKMKVVWGSLRLFGRVLLPEYGGVELADEVDVLMLKCWGRSMPWIGVCWVLLAGCCVCSCWVACGCVCGCCCEREVGGVAVLGGSTLRRASLLCCVAYRVGSSGSGQNLLKG